MTSLRFIPFLFCCLSAFLQADHFPQKGPQCLVIGAQKSGTSAFAKFLSKHPDVCNNFNEIDFFNFHFSNGADWYETVLGQRGRNRFSLDKSPNYMFFPKVPERVHALYPDVKIIAILRNPVDRAYSNYQMMKRNKSIPTTFEEELAREEKLISNDQEEYAEDPTSFWCKHHPFAYKSRGIYVEQLKRWLDYFPREQILVFSFEEFYSDPRRAMRKAFEFLGLRNYQWDTGYTVHSYPEMAEETRKQLAEYFRPYNQELEQLLGQKFDWD